MRTILAAAKHGAIVAIVFSFITSFAIKLQANDQANKVLDGFVESIKNSKELKAEQQKEILAAVADQRKDTDSLSVIITDAFAEANSDFAKALEHLGEEETKEALALLTKLQKSKNAYFATEAKYYTARAYLMNENYEKAEALLLEITGKLSKQSLNTADATYHLGVTQAHLLKRAEAIKTFEAFRKNFEKTASERQLVSAFQQIEELRYLEKGSLVDVEDRMDYSRRRLWLEKSGKRTRSEQDNIIAMLDKLIKEAEKKEGS